MPKVILDRQFTQTLPDGRQRTMPRSWQGEVSPAVAAEIKACKAGRVVHPPRKTAKAAAAKAPGARAGGGDGD